MIKNRKIIGLFLFAFILSIPAIGCLKPQENLTQHNISPQSQEKSVSIQTDFGCQTISLQEYLTGVVAAEMPSSFETEALKAQTVAAHTYALNRYGEDGPYPTDPSTFQAYINEQQRKQRFGEEFEQKQKRIEDIVKEMENLILVYNNQPIVAAFHSMSGGHTQNSADVWGGNLPYLVGTSSTQETRLPNYVTDIAVSHNDLKTILQQHFPNIAFSSSPSEWIKIISRTQADYVNQVQIGNVETSGTKIRSLFSLPSADFSVYSEQNNIIFTCKGKGHGVGMSQYGANEMAKEGKSFSEILAHYYAETTLKELK